MNRQEFSAKLVKIKNKAHVKLKDSLPYALQLNQNKVNALEKATFEYVMGNVFIYLKMCGTSMELIGKNVTYSTDNTDGLRKAIIAMRKSAGLSIRELAKNRISMNKERREELLEVTELLDEAIDRIGEIRGEEEDALYSLPEGLQESARGFAMQDAMDTLDGFVDSIDKIRSKIEEFARPKKKSKPKQ